MDDGKVLTKQQLNMKITKFLKLDKDDVYDCERLTHMNKADFIGVSYISFDYVNIVSCQSVNGQFNEKVVNFF
jgi:hypothetical protein